jgi:hypothetical protein
VSKGHDAACIKAKPTSASTPALERAMA